MITKDNWLTSEQLSELRKNMINAGLVKVIDYPKNNEIFTNVNVQVSIFLIEVGYDRETSYTSIVDQNIESSYKMKLQGFDIVPRSIEEYSIMAKTSTKYENSFAKLVSSKMPFGISTNGKLGATGDSPFLDEQDTKDDKYNIAVVYQNRVTYTYIDAFTKNKNLVSKYKLCAGQQLNNDSKVIHTIKIFGPNIITQQTYQLLHQSDDKEEIINTYKYVQSKLFRLLLKMNTDLLCTLTAQRFKLIPLQDFTSNSDIDWSKPIDDIDKQLYKKYNLTQEEIDYIEKTIKPMK